MSVDTPNFNNIPHDQRSIMRHAWQNKDFATVTKIMTEADALPGSCKTCNKNKKIQQWTDYLFKHTNYKDWEDGGLWTE